VDVDVDGSLRAEVRVVNACADCGTELTEATLEMEGQADVTGHDGEGHDLEVEESGCERTSRSGNFVKGVFKPGGGRYAKTFYGASLEVCVTCSCGKLGEDGKGVVMTLEGEEQASAMESLV
jgi:hypothetical protein